MKQIKIIASIGILLMFAIVLSGCSIESINNKVQNYIGGNKAAIDKAGDAKKAIEEINPVFNSEEEASVQDPVAGQVNELMKEVLGKTFNDSKLISANNVSNTPFILKYIVDRRINRADNDNLHKFLLDAESRIKDDAMPNYFSSRNTAEFSVYHDFGGRSYILAVVMDLAEQIIWVNVY